MKVKKGQKVEIENNIRRDQALRAELAWRESLPMTRENMEDILWIEAELKRTEPNVHVPKSRRYEAGEFGRDGVPELGEWVFLPFVWVEGSERGLYGKVGI